MSRVDLFEWMTSIYLMNSFSLQNENKGTAVHLYLCASTLLSAKVSVSILRTSIFFSCHRENTKQMTILLNVCVTFHARRNSVLFSVTFDTADWVLFSILLQIIFKCQISALSKRGILISSGEIRRANVIFSLLFYLKSLFCTEDKNKSCNGLRHQSRFHPWSLSLHLFWKQTHPYPFGFGA